MLLDLQSYKLLFLIKADESIKTYVDDDRGSGRWKSDLDQNRSVFANGVFVEIVDVLKVMTTMTINSRKVS
jgi:hypothetical protein